MTMLYKGKWFTIHVIAIFVVVCRCNIAILWQQGPQGSPGDNGMPGVPGMIGRPGKMASCVQ